MSERGYTIINVLFVIAGISVIAFGIWDDKKLESHCVELGFDGGHGSYVFNKIRCYEYQ